MHNLTIHGKEFRGHVQRHFLTVGLDIYNHESTNPRSHTKFMIFGVHLVKQLSIKGSYFQGSHIAVAGGK